MNTLALACFGLAFLCLALVMIQYHALARHLREPAKMLPQSREQPSGISILRPLCGVDDNLFSNLETAARLNYPSYELLLGVASTSDPAYPVALKAAARWPKVVRVVLQQGAPGYNPKVNQLVTLAKHARHDILVVSDSNVELPSNYLEEIDAHLDDPRTGLVTHPMAGEGEASLGALMDNIHLATNITAGIVAAKRLFHADFVVGKSMAFRRSDLRNLGGFEALKDFLAEDYLMGKWVSQKLHKSVVIARTPIVSICHARSVRSFFDRYFRWSTMQHKAVGSLVYGCQALLHPLAWALAGLLVAPGWDGLAAFTLVCATKGLLDIAATPLLRHPPSLLWLAISSLKDLLVLAAWAAGFFNSRVSWRGHELEVLTGTMLRPVHNSEPLPPQLELQDEPTQA